MTWKQTVEAYELLDSAMVTGQQVAGLLNDRGLASVRVFSAEGEKGGLYPQGQP